MWNAIKRFSKNKPFLFWGGLFLLIILLLSGFLKRVFNSLLDTFSSLGSFASTIGNGIKSVTSTVTQPFETSTIDDIVEAEKFRNSPLNPLNYERCDYKRYQHELAATLLKKYNYSFDAKVDLLKRAMRFYVDKNQLIAFINSFQNKSLLYRFTADFYNNYNSHNLIKLLTNVNDGVWFGSWFDWRTADWGVMNPDIEVAIYNEIKKLPYDS